MLSNYLKLSLRNISKNPLFTALNVFGLSLGLAVALCLFLFVKNERSFDQFYSNAAHIQRVVLNAKFGDGPMEQLANAPNVVGPSAKENIPAVRQFARILANDFTGAAFVTAGTKKLAVEKLVWADPGLVEIFNLKALSGDLKKALSEPNSVALSRSAAIQYFGTSDPVGQTIRIDRRDPMMVNAVYEDFPQNSTLEATVMGSFVSEKWANSPLVWSNASFETWLLLDPAADPKAVEAQLAALLERNVVPDDRNFSMWLQPLTAIHLGSVDISNNVSTRIGDPRQVGLLEILGLGILLIACFNYMNLATARAQTRTSEVGINKTMGATRLQLAGRFYLETGVLVSLSMLLALGLVSFGLPLFNHLADRNLSLTTFFTPAMLASFAGIGLAVILLAGAYPSLLLSSFLPKNLLQTTFQKNTSAGWMRRSLVTAQFSASVILMIGTVMLWRQMQFIQQKNLGFDPNQVVAINTTAAENLDQISALLDACRQISSVQAVCRAQTFPSGRPSGRGISKNETDENSLNLSTNRATPGVEKVLGIPLLAGTSLPEKAPGDTVVHVLLTKKAVDYLGYTPESALGKKVSCQLGADAIIVGVLADFHDESLHQPLGAYAFHDAETESRKFMLVKMATQNLPETMRQLENAVKSTLPNSPFEARFLDDQIEKMYRSDARTARVTLFFCLLSVLISCLGLFGLAAFAAEQRVKEIGIRKVLGASVAGIMGLLAADFLKLVFLAILIASPIAYWLIEKWLEDFTYHIEIQWWWCLIIGAFAMLLAFSTVSFQSVRAALANPVKSLRSE
jgi:putative ABC transport system permease protein